MADCDHMLVVWKFPLSFRGVTEHQLPVGARVLKAAVQEGAITLWIALDPRRATEARQFGVYATGEHLPIGAKSHVDTVLIEDGAYVFHVFELGSPVGRTL